MWIINLGIKKAIKVWHNRWKIHWLTTILSLKHKHKAPNEVWYSYIYIKCHSSQHIPNVCVCVVCVKIKELRREFRWYDLPHASFIWAFSLRLSDWSSLRKKTSKIYGQRSSFHFQFSTQMLYTESNDILKFLEIASERRLLSSFQVSMLLTLCVQFTSKKTIYHNLPNSQIL